MEIRLQFRCKIRRIRWPAAYAQLLDVAVQYFDKALGRLRFARIHLGVPAQHVKPNLAVDDLDEQTVDGSAASSDLLENSGAFLLLFDRDTDTLELTLKAIHPR